MATAQAIRDKYGVRKPIVSEMNINEAPVKIKGAEDTPKRLAKLMRKIAATEILRSNNARPGPPCGNIENNRCTHSV
jgi:hypothetical protein